MTQLLASLLGPNGATGLPVAASPSNPHNAAIADGQSPFHALFNQQLQQLQPPHQAGLAAAAAPQSGCCSPWQSLAMGGGNFPFAPAGVLPPSGVTLESVTYSRITINGNEIFNTLHGGADEQPQHALAEMLANIGAPTEQPAINDVAQVPAPPADNQAADAEAVKHETPPLDKLQDPGYLGEKIGQALANMSHAEVPNGEFAVDHPVYGRIEAQVDIRDDTVELAFGVQDPGLRAALEAARADIEHALSEKGLALAGLEVGAPQGAPGVVTPGRADELIASYAAQRDAALSRIISDLAPGLGDNQA